MSRSQFSTTYSAPHTACSPSYGSNQTTYSNNDSICSPATEATWLTTATSDEICTYYGDVLDWSQFDTFPPAATAHSPPSAAQHRPLIPVPVPTEDELRRRQRRREQTRNAQRLCSARKASTIAALSARVAELDAENKRQMRVNDDLVELRDGLSARVRAMEREVGAGKGPAGGRHGEAGRKQAEDESGWQLVQAMQAGWVLS